ncbi:MAG: aspartyl/asparaginyl beta-hydroxylase domain-containing protein [Deltaproteobacteria bacterium]|nr:aspartyl/asparaginyl beta-hydroxylase domain-containing protein [Deltaproteobacteria bacterium]
MDGPSLDTILLAARTLARAGQLDGSIDQYRAALAVDPANVEAHVFLTQALMKRGEAAAAARHGELAVAARPARPELHEHLGRAHAALVRSPAGEAALAAICAELPGAYTSLLHLTRLREARKDARATILAYTRAIKLAQLAGFWHAAASTPPWLREPVDRAHTVADAGRRVLFEAVLAPIHAKHGPDAMTRVEDCLAMYVGLKPLAIADARQRPSFLYFPGLPIAPVFDRAALPFADAYEAAAEAIRAEMRGVLEGGAGVEAFHGHVPEERRGMLTEGGEWDAYFFYRNGQRYADHHAACPVTSSTLAAIPLDHVRDHGPEVCYSIMRPAAHILPHRGITNTRAVLHLGLDIPEGCALDVKGIEILTWQAGRCFAFDDTYEHEAWNRSDTTRVVLLGDIWNPYLTEAERDAIAALVAEIGDFNRATEVRPRG